MVTTFYNSLRMDITLHRYYDVIKVPVVVVNDFYMAHTTLTPWWAR